MITKGIIYALGACFLWGLIFVIPQFLAGFSCLEVALGRYFFYGLISICIFLKEFLQKKFQYPVYFWRKALYFSLICTIGFYTFLVLALRYSTSSVPALVLGISPITIAFYGNWKEKKTSFKNLIIPSLLITTGLITYNIPNLSLNDSSSLLLGFCCSAICLGMWTWYAVKNAQFLKNHTLISSSDWATLIGINTFFWVIILATFIFVFFNDLFETEKYFKINHELISFFIGSAILGLLCSWVGATLWNKACLCLPIFLAGQLTIFETIFGIFFVYLIDQKPPSLIEGAGIGILFATIIYSARNLNREYLLHEYSEKESKVTS